MIQLLDNLEADQNCKQLVKTQYLYVLTSQNGYHSCLGQQQGILLMWLDRMKEGIWWD